MLQQSEKVAGINKQETFLMVTYVSVVLAVLLSRCRPYEANQCSTLFCRQTSSPLTFAMDSFFLPKDKKTAASIKPFILSAQE